jgi:hypothetical protein
MRFPEHTTIIAGLALIACVVSTGREVAFRHGAEPSSATVRSWQSRKLGGFVGTARVDIDSKGDDPPVKNTAARTILWYRPAPGERVEVLRKPGQSPHLGSPWQGFGLAGLSLVIALGSGAVGLLTRKRESARSSEE